MNLHSTIIDQFWTDSDYLTTRKELFALPSKTITVANTVEEVVDSSQIGPQIIECITSTLEAVTREQIRLQIAYLRKTAGSRVYHNAGFSQFGAILFFSNYGGVSTVAHTAAGIWKAPVDARQQYIYDYSRSLYTDWAPVTVCPAKHNRLFLVRSDLLQRMEFPNTITGQEANASTVMIVLFDVVSRRVRGPRPESVRKAIAAKNKSYQQRVKLGLAALENSSIHNND